MEDFTTRGRVDELNLASRRAEEAALRRYQAVHWLDYLVGPLGIPSQPSEKEFISCLRSGLVLCNMINKIQSGSVPKVIKNNLPSSLQWDSQPLPAYQYFENIRNFLAAAEELKLPVFEASVFERDNLLEGSSTKVVDCILALKAYHEWKQMTGGNGVYKPPRSPLVLHSSGRIDGRTPGFITHDISRRLDMSGASNKPVPSMSEITTLEDKVVKALAEQMIDTKENMDCNLFDSYRCGNTDAKKFFSKILLGCLEEQFQRTFPEMKSSILDHLRERSCSALSFLSVPTPDLSSLGSQTCCRACSKKGKCRHWNMVEQQEKELSNIKMLLSKTKVEFESLQSQLQHDLNQLGNQVLELSTAALGYHKVVKENKNLYNMVQDLKGNIRVYCRIRPIFNPEIENIIDFMGEDGSLVVVDPLKPQKDGKKAFQFNRVFGPTANQDEVFQDTRPLIRSVLDGFNVCILAYGQTGSGKTYTMCGPPGGSAKELGISYLALNYLFELSEQRKNIMTYEIQVQMVEIYNKQVRDLLAEDSGTTKLEIQSCASENSLVLPDAKLHTVRSTTDVINLMKFGELNRAVGSTAINIRSSRSHSILTVHVQGVDISGSIVRSCLHLVDLAGSERVDKSEVTGDGLREAQHINKSLSCLGDVITALAQKNSHIPYRNSKLTLLLQNSLGGSAKTLMFAHVSPEEDSFGETMSTLKFAQRASTVELGAARANKESTEVLELKAQIESLKKALANKEVQTPQSKKPKETARTPFKTSDKTPPRPRRLSIESGSNLPTINNIEKRQGAKMPFKMKEKTPPRTRRLSIENGSSTLTTINNGEKKRGANTPISTARSRRLSLEGPRNVLKESDQKKLPEKILSPGPLTSHQKAPPRSPTSSVVQSTAMITIDTAIKVPNFQIPKTPEPQIKSRNEVQRTLHHSEQNISLDMQTPFSTLGKGSQIRKSLRTIGKLINGSEKRNQQKSTEPMTPVGLANNGAKSPVSSTARALRRQSLTGIPQERSRRSSLGGVSTDSCTKENRNAKTPPQVRASVKLTKRWL